MRRAWGLVFALLLGCSAESGGGSPSGTGRDRDPMMLPDGGGTADPFARRDAGPLPDSGLGECATTEAEAETTVRPIDIVWVVDSSGSMDNEAARVQENMNRFATDIVGAGIDPHVVVITDPDFVTVPPPLGTDPMQYRFVNQGVGSHAGLERLISEWPRYSDFLRPDAVTHFVAVTDDESDISADMFDAAMAGLLGHEYVFHAIASEDTGGGRECSGAADVGRQYYTLADRTGGLQVSICTSDWAAVFTELARAVTETAPLPCEFTIPDPPADGMLDYDAVNVQYFPSSGTGGATIPRVDSPSSCTGSGGWHYDDPGAPTLIELCPSSCTLVGGDPEGRVTIALGCATLLL